MKRIAVLTQRLAVGVITAVLAGQASAEPLVFSCVNLGDQSRCKAGGAGLAVEILDSGDGKAAFVLVNNSSVGLAVDRVYVEDRGGTLVGPPQILNNEPEVSFEWTGKQKQFAGAAGVRPVFRVDPNLSVVAQQPGARLGINAGESLGLVYDIAIGRTLADVIHDLNSGKLRFGVDTVDPSGSARGSLVTQTLARAERY
jgi:hypothetical protein